MFKMVNYNSTLLPRRMGIISAILILLCFSVTYGQRPGPGVVTTTAQDRTEVTSTTDAIAMPTPPRPVPSVAGSPILVPSGQLDPVDDSTVESERILPEDRECVCKDIIKYKKEQCYLNEEYIFDKESCCSRCVPRSKKSCDAIDCSQFSGPSYPICATNSETYANRCLAEKAACNSSVPMAILNEDRCGHPFKGATVYEPHCKRPCNVVEKNPVCATTGFTPTRYNNFCTFLYASCRRVRRNSPYMLYTDENACNDQCDDKCPGEPPACPLGKELQINRDRCCEECTQIADCSSIKCPHQSEPVCGNDGHNYMNECFANMAACFHIRDGRIDDKFELKVASRGRCPNATSTAASTTPTLPRCPSKCSEVEHLVCSKSNITYTNMCELVMDACTRQNVDGKIELLHQGKCNEFSHLMGAPDGQDCKMMKCKPVSYPVCGNDGKTYPNSCFLHREHCENEENPNLKILSYGPCPVKESTSEITSVATTTTATAASSSASSTADEPNPTKVPGESCTETCPSVSDCSFGHKLTTPKGECCPQCTKITDCSTIKCQVSENDGISKLGTKKGNCGNDGMLYMTRCEMDLAYCYGHTDLNDPVKKEESMDECLNENSFPRCPTVCSNEENEICGDGTSMINKDKPKKWQTFTNMCHLVMSQCKNGLRMVNVTALSACPAIQDDTAGVNTANDETSASSDNDNDNSDKNEVFIGAIAGALAGILLITALVISVMCYRKRKNRTPRNENLEIDEVAPQPTTTGQLANVASMEMSQVSPDTHVFGYDHQDDDADAVVVTTEDIAQHEIGANKGGSKTGKYQKFA